MKTFYKLENNILQRGSGTLIPNGFLEYTIGKEPLEMLDIINAEKAEYDANQYQRDRAVAYPSLQDQADMAYWDRKNGTTTLDDAIDAVKAAHPKPE